MTNVFNVTKKWSERLEAVGCDPNVGEQLVRHVLQYDYTGWIMALNEEVEGEALERMERLGARLLRGEPFQYVIEEAYFFNRPFYADCMDISCEFRFDSIFNSYSGWAD